MADPVTVAPTQPRAYDPVNPRRYDESLGALIDPTERSKILARTLRFCGPLTHGPHSSMVEQLREFPWAEFPPSPLKAFSPLHLRIPSPGIVPIALEASYAKLAPLPAIAEALDRMALKTVPDAPTNGAEGGHKQTGSLTTEARALIMSALMGLHEAETVAFGTQYGDVNDVNMGASMTVTHSLRVATLAASFCDFLCQHGTKNEIEGSQLSEFDSGHLAQLEEFKAMFGGESGTRTDKLPHIFVAGLLHDLGKVVRPTLFMSRNTFTDEQRELAKHHTGDGFHILNEEPYRSVLNQSLGGFDEILPAIVAMHHRDWNGRGYGLAETPGQSGDLLPFLQRILHICDVMDALVSPRGYKRGMNIPAAFEMMRIQSFHSFDPSLIHQFSRFLSSVSKGFQAAADRPKDTRGFDLPQHYSEPHVFNPEQGKFEERTLWFRWSEFLLERLPIFGSRLSSGSEATHVNTGTANVPEQTSNTFTMDPEQLRQFRDRRDRNLETFDELLAGPGAEAVARVQRWQLDPPEWLRPALPTLDGLREQDSASAGNKSKVTAKTIVRQLKLEWDE